MLKRRPWVDFLRPALRRLPSLARQGTAGNFTREQHIVATFTERFRDQSATLCPHIMIAAISRARGELRLLARADGDPPAPASRPFVDLRKLGLPLLVRYRDRGRRPRLPETFPGQLRLAGALTQSRTPKPLRSVQATSTAIAGICPRGRPDDRRAMGCLSAGPVDSNSAARVYIALLTAAFVRHRLSTAGNYPARRHIDTKVRQFQVILGRPMASIALISSFSPGRWARYPLITAPRPPPWAQATARGGMASSQSSSAVSALIPAPTGTSDFFCSLLGTRPSPPGHPSLANGEPRFNTTLHRCG